MTDRDVHAAMAKVQADPMFHTLGKVAHGIHLAAARAVLTDPVQPILADICEDPALLLRFASHAMRKGMREKGRAWPSFFFFTRHSMHSIFLEQMPVGQLAQAGLCAVLQAMLIRSPIEAYWIGCEAWMANYDRDHQDVAVFRLGPHEREDKEEVVVIATGLRAGARHNLAMHRIVRDRKGSVLDLAQFTPDRLPDETSGDFVMSRNLYDFPELRDA